MFTAAMAREGDQSDLDVRIKNSVRNRRNGAGAYLRVYHDDPWRYSIESDLAERGFVNIDVPDIILEGDVYFEWGDDG